MIGFLKEKHGKHAGTGSATRVVTFLMALAYDAAMLLSAKAGHFHDLGGWVVALGVVLNLAVPVQGWLQTRSGQDALAKATAFLADKLGAKTQP